MTEESSEHMNQASTSTTNYTATHINYFIHQTQLNFGYGDKNGYSFSN